MTLIDIEIIVFIGFILVCLLKDKFFKKSCNCADCGFNGNCGKNNVK